MIHEIQHTAQQHNNNSSVSEGYGMSQNPQNEWGQATFDSLQHPAPRAAKNVSGAITGKSRCSCTRRVIAAAAKRPRGVGGFRFITLMIVSRRKSDWL